MEQPVNEFWQDMGDSPDQRVLHETRTAPVSLGTSVVQTVTKKQGDGLSWTVTVA